MRSRKIFFHKTSAAAICLLVTFLLTPLPLFSCRCCCVSSFFSVFLTCLAKRSMQKVFKTMHSLKDSQLLSHYTVLGLLWKWGITYRIYMKIITQLIHCTGTTVPLKFLQSLIASSSYFFLHALLTFKVALKLHSVCSLLGYVFDILLFAICLIRSLCFIIIFIIIFFFFSVTLPVCPRSVWLIPHSIHKRHIRQICAFQE